jgi:hypothetical protein
MYSLSCTKSIRQLKYYSCAFVRVRGGFPLASSYMPRFIPDMPRFSKDGCMSANDMVGKCPVEPCVGPVGSYIRPAGFGNGKTPEPVTPATFGGSGGGKSTLVLPSPNPYDVATRPNSTGSVADSEPVLAAPGAANNSYANGDCARAGEQCNAAVCCDVTATCARIDGDGIVGTVCSGPLVRNTSTGPVL